MSIALDSLLYGSQGLGDFSLAKMVVDIIISEVPKIKAKVNFSFKNILYASFCNLAIVYVFGMIYYYAIGNYFINSPIGLYTLILYCFILAVPGDILLCLISTCVAKKVIPVINNSIQSTEENSKFISKNI